MINGKHYEQLLEINVLHKKNILLYTLLLFLNNNKTKT